MSCDNVITVQDLETDKKHSTFYREVITGKAGGTGADIDYATNAVTGQVQKTLPKTLDDLDWSYVGLFADGVTFTDKTDFAVDAVGTQWIYTGSLPFSATAGTVPSEPTYQVVHVKNASAISNANGGSVQDFIDETVSDIDIVKSNISSNSLRINELEDDDPLGQLTLHNSNPLAHPQLSDFITSEADRAGAAAEAASASGWIYPTAAAGSAARSEGEYFWVVSDDTNEVLELWLMGATTATDTGKRTPSNLRVENSLIESAKVLEKSYKSQLLPENLFSRQQANCEVLPDEIAFGSFQTVLINGQKMIKASQLASGSITLSASYASVDVANFDSGKISASVIIHSANVGHESKLILQQLGDADAVVQSNEVVLHGVGESIDKPTEFALTCDVNASANRAVRLVLSLNRQSSAGNDREVIYHSVSISDGEQQGFRAPEKREKIELNGNLINPATMQYGFSLDPTYGTPVANASFALTDFIPVNGLADYSSNKSITRYAMYDSNKNVINKTSTNATTFTTHSRAHFVRLVLAKSDVSSQNLTESSSPQSFTPFHIDSSETATLAKNGLNLINYSNMKRGSLSDSTGQEVVSSTIMYTEDYTQIDSFVDKISFSKTTGFSVVFYNNNKEFISKSSSQTSTVPNGAVFVRFTINQLLIPGLIATVGDSVGNIETVSKDYFVDDMSVLNSQISFMSKTANLVDKKSLVQGFRYDSYGNIEANSTYSLCQDYIPIPLGESHITGKFPLTAAIVFYDFAKVIISREVLLNTTSLAIPSGAKYFRYSIHKSNESKAMMYFGEGNKNYREYGYFVDKSKLVFSEYDKISLPLRITDDYYVADPSFNYSAYPFDKDAYTIEDLESDWQALVNSNPDYLTREVLGKDASGTYDCIKITASPEVSNLEATGFKKPKIIIIAGNHGFEKHSMLDTYLMMKFICENWRESPVLEFLRWNVEFVINPYANPWGYNNGDTAELGRRNSNGVDLNRNFTAFWEKGDSDPSSIYFRGQSPLSEPESQYTDNIIAENNDAICMIEHHNHSGTTLNNLVWLEFPTGDGYNPKLDKACYQTFLDTGRSFTGSPYNVSGSGLAGFSTTADEVSNNYNNAYYSHGVPSMLIETFKTMENNDRAGALKGCVEVMVNLMINLVRAYR